MSQWRGLFSMAVVGRHGLGNLQRKEVYLAPGSGGWLGSLFLKSHASHSGGGVSFPFLAQDLPPNATLGIEGFIFQGTNLGQGEQCSYFSRNGQCHTVHGEKDQKDPSRHLCCYRKGQMCGKAVEITVHCVLQECLQVMQHAGYFDNLFREIQ